MIFSYAVRGEEKRVTIIVLLQSLAFTTCSLIPLFRNFLFSPPGILDSYSVVLAVVQKQKEADRIW